MRKILLAALLGAGLCASAKAVSIELVDKAPTLKPAPVHTGGRLQPLAQAGIPTLFALQWPGAYLETAFEGQEIYFSVGKGDTILHVLVDNEPAIPLVKPAAGLYRIGALIKGSHRIRIEAVNESQSGPMQVGAFALPHDAKALPLPVRTRQIEFIGDSHTVGYGNTFPKRECTPDDVWRSTDNSQAFGPLTAKHYGADYLISAISGRGIVRNYNGGPGDTLPSAYPYVLFDKKNAYSNPAWQPQFIVIGLGTNDFSTPLNPGEKWKSREELHADYEANYVRFVQQLRAAKPNAYFILLANDLANGEMQTEVQNVVAQLKAAGEQKVAYIPISNMALTACDWHPSLEDHQLMSKAVTVFIDAHPELWQGK